MAKAQNETVILNGIYPIVSNNLDKNKLKYKQVLSRFIEKRSNELYDVAPCDRIFFNQDDKDDFYNTMKLNPSELDGFLSQTYYYNLPMYRNNQSLKDGFSITILSVIRYFYLKNMKQETEMAMIHLAFSGKFYPSIHYKSFPKVLPSQYRHVMDYVINNVMTNKYDIVREGNVIGAVRSICNTWLVSYSSRLKSFHDDDIVYLIQQLSSRISSFIKNIATLYYEAYDNKDEYMTYDSDSMNDDDYRLADSDSLRAERISQNALTKIHSSGVDFRLCKMSSDSNVKTDEIKTIIESILSNNDNINEVSELIKLIINIYFSNSKTKDVRDIDFITFSITPKPNSKDSYYIRQREIIETLLNKNAINYRKRSKRLATKNSYNTSMLKYFVLLIHETNK